MYQLCWALRVQHEVLRTLIKSRVRVEYTYESAAPKDGGRQAFPGRVRPADKAPLHLDVCRIGDPRMSG